MFRSGPIAGRWTTVGLVEEVHELAIARRDLGDSLFARRLLGPPGNQRIPEIGAADRKAEKPGTFAAIPIHSRTFCSSSPRPRTIQPTWSRPPARAAATIL